MFTHVPLRRVTDAAEVNAVLNDPDVRPWVASAAEGVIDVTAQVANPNNIFLLGEHGGNMFLKVFPGVYEVHTFVRKAGRGAWAVGLVRASQHWLFTRTDAYEILTRIPHTHRAALGLAIRAGMSLEFTRPDGINFNGEIIPVDVYRLTIQDWIKRDQRLLEAGQRFHNWLNLQAAKAGFVSPHEDDENHNRYVGATLEMALGGQVVKGVLSYNRWAWISRHATISLVSVDPPTIDFDIGRLRLIDGELQFQPK